MPQRNQGPAQIYFLEHVNDVTDECMIWPYSTVKGYGQVTFDGHNRLVTTRACEVHHGLAPEPGMEAAHGPCRNPRCWNWQHLSWKTPAENTADKERDGTIPRGEAHWRSKLTDSDVLAIRKSYAGGGVTQLTLAERYGVKREAVSKVVRRERWAWLSP